MKSNLFIIVFSIFISTSLFVKGQNLVFKDATVSRPAQFWKPFVLANGTNIEKGVSFYVTKTVCDSVKTKFMKLINENPYAVIFSYQLTASDPIVNVLVPASVSIEGSCNPSDENASKLILLSKENKIKTEEKTKENKEFLLSHISVSRFQ